MNKEKRPQNTEKEYDDALATDDPTSISGEDLEDLARQAVKKFKSLE